MVDLWQNAIVTGIVGALILFVLTFATWAVRRTFHRQDRDIDNQDRKIEKQDREIEKMADNQKEIERMLAETQKEIGQKLAGVLEREKELSADLQSGMEKVDLKFENMRLTFDKDIEGLRHSFREMNASASARDKVVERDLAEVREWLKGDGTWPSRNNGAG